MSHTEVMGEPPQIVVQTQLVNLLLLLPPQDTHNKMNREKSDPVVAS